VSVATAFVVGMKFVVSGIGSCSMCWHLEHLPTPSPPALRYLNKRCPPCSHVPAEARADDIAIIDVRGDCPFTDWMVLATARRWAGVAGGMLCGFDLGLQ